jgi:hypothetical protein
MGNDLYMDLKLSLQMLTLVMVLSMLLIKSILATGCCRIGYFIKDSKVFKSPELTFLVQAVISSGLALYLTS